MDGNVVTALSIACALVGGYLCFAPANKYHRKSAGEVGTIGIAFVMFGVVLMTTFKWGDVALEVMGQKLELKQARAAIEALESQIQQRDAAIASIKMSASFSEQLAAVKDVKQKADTLGVSALGVDASPEKIQETLALAGYSVVPTSELTKFDGMINLKAYTGNDGP